MIIRCVGDYNGEEKRRVCPGNNFTYDRSEGELKHGTNDNKKIME